MANDDTILKLLNIKVVALTCIRNLEAVLNIRDTWDSDDEEIIENAITIELHCEDANVNYHEIVDLVGHLLHDSPLNLRHRILELKVLSGHAQEYVELLESEVQNMNDLADELEDMNLPEVRQRVIALEAKARELSMRTVRLCQDVRSNASNAAERA